MSYKKSRYKKNYGGRGRKHGGLKRGKVRHAYYTQRGGIRI